MFVFLCSLILCLDSCDSDTLNNYFYFPKLLNWGRTFMVEDAQSLSIRAWPLLIPWWHLAPWNCSVCSWTCITVCVFLSLASWWWWSLSSSTGICGQGYNVVISWLALTTGRKSVLIPFIRQRPMSLVLGRAQRAFIVGRNGQDKGRQVWGSLGLDRVNNFKLPLFAPMPLHASPTCSALLG